MAYPHCFCPAHCLADVSSRFPTSTIPYHIAYSSYCVVCWYRLWPENHIQETSVIGCPIAFGLYSCQLTSGVAFPHCLWPAHNGKLVSNMAFPHAFVLQRMVNQRHTLPTRIAFVLHTIVSRHRTCATPIICGLHKSISQRRTCPAIIFISLYTLVYRCHT